VQGGHSRTIARRLLFPQQRSARWPLELQGRAAAIYAASARTVCRCWNRDALVMLRVRDWKWLRLRSGDFHCISNGCPEHGALGIHPAFRITSTPILHFPGTLFLLLPCFRIGSCVGAAWILDPPTLLLISVCPSVTFHYFQSCRNTSYDKLCRSSQFCRYHKISLLDNQHFLLWSRWHIENPWH
jgi:hypothetical protein